MNARTTLCYHCKGNGTIEHPYIDRDWLQCPACKGKCILFDGLKISDEFLPTEDFNGLETVCCKYNAKGRLPDIVLRLKRIILNEEKIATLENELKSLKSKVL